MSRAKNVRRLVPTVFAGLLLWMPTIVSGQTWETCASSGICFSGGNVGIGTTNPGSALAVSGNVTLSYGNQLIFGSGSYGPSLITNYDEGYGSTPLLLFDEPNCSTGAGSHFCPPGVGSNMGEGEPGIFAGVNAAYYGFESIATFGSYGLNRPQLLTLINNGTPSAGIQSNIYLDAYSTSNGYTSATQFGIIGMVTTNVGSAYTGDLTFSTANASSPTEKMRITSGGNVGIGTTTPAHPLDVQGQINATGYCINGGSCISSWPSVSGAVTSVFGRPGPAITAAAGDYNASQIAGLGTFATQSVPGSNGQMFYNSGGLPAAAPGITTPDGNTVVANSYSTGASGWTLSTTGGFGGVMQLSNNVSNGQSILNFMPNGTAHGARVSFINSSATTGAAEGLNVGIQNNGSIAVIELNPGDLPPATPITEMRIGENTGLGYLQQIDFRFNDVIQASVSNTGVVTANGATFSGNVGIGTTTPAHPLDVQGQINATGYCINGGSCINAWPSVGTITSVFGRTGAVTAAYGDYSAAQIAGLGTFATQSVPGSSGQLFYNNSGSAAAGAGIMTPDGNSLSLAGAVSVGGANGFQLINNTSTGGLQVQSLNNNQSNVDVFPAGSATTSRLRVWNGNDTTDANNSSLSVSVQGGAAYLRTSTQGMGAPITSLGVGENSGNSNLTAINFLFGGTTQASLSNTGILSAAGASFTGNVGIGTTTPQSALSVNGTITTQEVVVTSAGWSDYVFDPSYKLAPLADVADYIRANHHLPDIPSAKDVEEKGASVGEIQSKLLAKIEELTLHMIDAEKRSERLEQENRELRERVARIEAGQR